MPPGLCKPGGSALLSLLVIVALAHSAIAQDSASQHSAAGRSLSAAATNSDQASVRSWIAQQRRRLQQRISQSQPALSVPFATTTTATSERRNRDRTVAVASTQQATTPRAVRRQQRNQQALQPAAQQEVPAVAANPIDSAVPAVPVPVAEVPVPVPAVPAPAAEVPVSAVPVLADSLPGEPAPKAAATATPAARVLPTEPELDVEMSPKAGGISPSILLMGYFDWQNMPDANGRPWSRCLDMVWRARRLTRGNKLNFVPTHHWLPREDGFGVSSFCYMHKTPGLPNTVTTANGMYCSPWNDALIQEFEDSMATCFAESLRQGLTPYIRPHLDDGLVK